MEACRIRPHPHWHQVIGINSHFLASKYSSLLLIGPKIYSLITHCRPCGCSSSSKIQSASIQRDITKDYSTSLTTENKENKTRENSLPLMAGKDKLSTTQWPQQFKKLLKVENIWRPRFTLNRGILKRPAKYPSHVTKLLPEDRWTSWNSWTNIVW